MKLEVREKTPGFGPLRIGPWNTQHLVECSGLFDAKFTTPGKSPNSLTVTQQKNHRGHVKYPHGVRQDGLIVQELSRGWRCVNHKLLCFLSGDVTGAHRREASPLQPASIVFSCWPADQIQILRSWKLFIGMPRFARLLQAIAATGTRLSNLFISVQVCLFHSETWNSIRVWYTPEN